MRLNKATLWLSALMLLGGCPEHARLNAVTVTCDHASVEAGQPTHCKASATDQDDQPFTVSGFSWTSNNESVAKVDSTGMVTTFTAGTVAISASASAEGVTQQGQATLTVTQQPPPQLSTVTVTCDSTSIPASRPTRCTASATDQYGQPFAISSYAWTSSNESVAKVGSTGKVTTTIPGPATLSANATAGGVTRQGQTTITVTEAQPTLHTTLIAANETWRASENPHVVRGPIEVRGASTPTLTIEEGVEIRFEQDAEIVVTDAALRALGTEEAPIRMVSDQSTPTKGHWRGVVFRGGGNSSEMNHVTLSDCGNSLGMGACIYMENQTTPVLRHVTVRNSGTAGVAIEDDGSGFGVGSTALSVSGSEGYAVTVGANQAGTLPTGGTFSGNKPDAVALAGNVTTTQTWPNLGIPYVASTNIYVDSASNPTLTLAAGTEVRFAAETELWIGYSGPAALIAVGTEAKPIRFGANLPTPVKGFWVGLHFRNAAGSRLDYVSVTHGGAGGFGNVDVYNEIGAFITNSTFSDSAACGISRSDGSRFNNPPVTTDFTLPEHNNTFANNDGGAQCTSHWAG